MGRAWRAGVAGAVLSALLATPAFGQAAPPAPPPAPAPATQPPAPPPPPKPPASPTESPSPSIDVELAAHLKQRAQQQARELEAGVARQQEAANTATAALEAFQAARRASQAADRHEASQTRMLKAAERRTVVARERLARYIGSLYKTGMGNRQLAVYASLMDTRKPEQLFRGLGMVSRVGGNQNDAFIELTRAEEAQTRAAARAKAAAEQAKVAHDRAAEAKEAADAVVAQAVSQVNATVAALAKTEQALALAEQREARIRTASMIARQRAAIPVAAIDGALAPRPVPECKGAPTGAYPNGRLPLPALCPLWGTSGQLLRWDAAATFDEMSKEFGAEFGEPICVTDSYRSYEEQVAVKILKPTLAAVPGSSNHGWGVALDLCGGIQDFTSKQHAWMVANSMAYGWFLPGWAQQGGSKPEPWHWEFAG